MNTPRRVTRRQLASVMVRAAARAGHVASLRAGPGRPSRCASSCRSRRAARPTWSRACWRRSSRMCGARRWWWKTAPARAATSAPTWRPSRRPTATRCSWPRAASPSTSTSTRTSPSTPEKDLVPITNVASGPMMVVVPEARRRRTLKDLIAMAKAKPGAVNFGSAGHRQPGAPRGGELRRRGRDRHQPRPVQGRGPGLHRPDRRPDADSWWATLRPPRPCGQRPPARAGRHQQAALAAIARCAHGRREPPAGLRELRLVRAAGARRHAGRIIDKVYRDTAKVLAKRRPRQRLYVQGMAPVGNTPAEFGKADGRELAALGHGGQEPQAHTAVSVERCRR